MLMLVTNTEHGRCIIFVFYLFEITLVLTSLFSCILYVTAMLYAYVDHVNKL